MKNKIIIILLILFAICFLTPILTSQDNEPYANYIKRVQNYIKAEGLQYELYEDFEKQEPFKNLLTEIKNKQIFMFGDYYRCNEVNLLSTKMFIFLHKNAGYKDFLIDIDAGYQDSYDKWLRKEQTPIDFVPYFTKEAEKILIDYYSSLSESKKFRILCMRNAEQDEGETFTSRIEYMNAGGDDEGYREVIAGNKLKTFIRKLLDKNPKEKYYIYVNAKETTKLSDMNFFKAEYERVGTYLNERNPITKGKVFSTACAVRSGRVAIGRDWVSVVTNDKLNNLPYLIENIMGINVKFMIIPLTKGFNKGAIFDKVRDGGWQLDALAPQGGTSLVDTMYNSINKRWNYLFYFREVSPWKR